MSAPGTTTASTVCEFVGARVGPAGDADVTSIAAIDWQVRAGDYWVLMGWPGSGKGDLLSTMAGLQRPLAGRFVVLGHDLSRLDPSNLVEFRRRVGFVFGDGGRLFNDLTIAENVALPLAYHSDRSLEAVLPEIEALVTLTGLTHCAARLPGAVGRSWRQRAALARALTLDPELLLIADPVSGFDSRQINWWREFLLQLNQGRHSSGRLLTIVVTTEDLRPWTNHTGQFAVIHERRLSVYRSKQELAAQDSAALREWFGGGGFEIAPPAGVQEHEHGI